MKISVITVCWNSEATIGHTIDSFLDQTHTDRELIIVDGASSDRTCAIVEGYGAPEIKLISEPDKGMYDALNKGLALIAGDVVVILNSDDAYHSNESLSKIDAALATSVLAP